MIPWLIVAVSLGLAAAFIARAKGQPFLPWLAYGLLLGVVAVPHALFMRPKYDDDRRVPLRPRQRPDAFDQSAFAASAARPDARAGNDARARDIHAVWSDDAFERISGGKSRRAESAAAPPPQRAAASARPAPEMRMQAPPPSGPASADDIKPSSVPDPDQRDMFVPSSLDEEEPPPARMNGHHGPSRDYLYPDSSAAREPTLRLPSEEDKKDEDEAAARIRAPEAPGMSAAAASSSGASATDGREAGAADRPAADAAASAAAEDTGGEDETVRIARHFSPDPLGPRPDYVGRRRRPDRSAGWGYAAAAACLILAVVVLWPQLSDLSSPPQVASRTGGAPSDVARPQGPAPETAEGRGASADGPVPGSATPPSPAADMPASPPPAVAASGPAPDLPPPDVPQVARAGDGGAETAPPGEPPIELEASQPVFVPSRGVTPPDMAAAPQSPLDIGPPGKKPPVPGRAEGARQARSAEPPAAASRPARRAEPRQTPRAETEVISAAGQMVVLLQAALTQRGYDPGPVNGRAGNKTREAIIAFKRKEGLGSNSTIDDRLLERLGIVGQRLHPFAASRR